MAVALNKKPNKNLLYVLFFAFLLSLFLYYYPNTQNVEEVELSTFVKNVKEELVEKIEVEDNKLLVTLVNTDQQITFKEPGQTVQELLSDLPQNVREKPIVEVKDTSSSGLFLNIILTILPFAIIVGFFIYMMRQAQSSSNQALSFGKSKARLTNKEKGKKTTFKNVAGAEEAKEELIEVVDFLKKPGKYTTIGAKIPKGVILVGPPGCGKTLLARAVSGEANVPFFNISGSEFVEMFVGVGASRVRDLFKKAKRNAPCIIFIDEIDAVGRQRGAGLGGGHDEREQTLNQILTEMDGFENETGIIVMAATNRPDVLDPALLRPGRFDRRVVVDLPDIKDRKAILKIHSSNKPLIKNVDLEKIARHTPGFSGADLENLMNEAAILAARRNKKAVGMRELEESIEKVLMGPERKSRVLTKKEREITAHHETGHALVSHLLPNCDPVHKISIVSRGRALGVTWLLPEEDKHLHSVSKFKDELCSLLGGHVAEKIVFGEVTTGSSNDLQRATGIAKKMVTEYGMSSLGPVIYGEQNHEVFLGRDFMHTKNYSEEVAKQIDNEVKKLVGEAFTKTEDIISKNLPLLKKIAKKLLEVETLSEEEFKKFFEKPSKKTSKTPKKA